MPELSKADHSVSPPQVEIPRQYNAAYDLIERNLTAGRSAKIAFIDDHGSTSYAELSTRVNRCAGALTALGLRMESRVMLCLLDSIDFPTAFLGSIKAGIVPIAANTLLTTADYAYMLADSRASALIVSEALLPLFAPLLGSLPLLKHVIVSGKESHGHLKFSDLLADAKPEFNVAPTTSDDVCFWLYSSGSTGAPKGVVHLHSHPIQTAELYARPVLGIVEGDVMFSASKLFFAYGLGNSLTFPMSVGATAVLMAERPTPAAVAQRLVKHQPTIFCGAPTLYAALLASTDLPTREQVKLRRCSSAAEPLPADIGKRWSARFGVDILDGIGSTEMLHIYLCNRPGDVRYGTTGKPVPGYQLRVVDEAGNEVATGETGELQVSGPSSAIMYWNNRARSLATFNGPWTRSGDKYLVDADGYYVYCGRSDDMLKVGGIYVSPVEVEAALITHEAVLEAAVVGCVDEQKLMKPKAFVVLKAGHAGSDALAKALQQHVKDQLAHYKYPRWIEFMSELPKTATGKIQRFKLRTKNFGG
jgi:benzoate-CoA ligase